MDAGKYAVVTFAVGTLLTVVFWSELWLGGGLIGGDVYSYFLPQKVFYAEQLAEGRIPLWNDRVGFGYPVFGESQTGALYPTNLFLYTTLDVNTAYNASQLIHYVLTFAAAVWFLRTIRVSRTAAAFGAMVYTYSWFPPRICLEWAALGGPYLPLGLAAIESFLRTHHRRHLIALTIALATHLLAGHYNLAFIECVVWSLYAGGRLLTGGQTNENNESSSTESKRDPRARQGFFLAASIVAGFALPSFQLIETYSLKQQSQRQRDDGWQTAAYGHIPPIYLSQTFASWWYWYSPDRNTDVAIKNLPSAASGDTNKVEAHLYFGLIPLGMALAAIPLCRRLSTRRIDWLLIAFGGFATVYATGLFVPFAKHFPGFGYFIGPGRWGIVVTLVVSVLAARAADVALQRLSTVLGGVAIAAAALLSLVDLCYVSQLVTYARVVPTPPIAFLDRSPTKQFFDQVPTTAGPPRVYAPGPNVVSLLGVTQWPTYLGLGPDVYWKAMPPRPDGVEGMFYSNEQRAWLAENAVQYVLSFAPLDEARWQLEPAFTTADPVLNAIWGRGVDERIHIYRLTDAKPQIGFANLETGSIEFVSDEPDCITFNATSSRPVDEGAIEVRRFLNTNWDEDPSYDRWTKPTPLLMRDQTIAATAAAESVGGYSLKYRPAWLRPKLIFVWLALTLFGLGWPTWLILSRQRTSA